MRRSRNDLLILLICLFVWFVRPIPHGGPSTVVTKRTWYVLSCAGYKRSLAANRKRIAYEVSAAGSFFCNLSRQLPNIRRHITVNKMC